MTTHGTTHGTVEAGSLSALNLLASNPPQYPHNPTEEQREPLTLYISRVPGTRDVILSPLKPLRKNVTGEDIANALYYIHLDQPTDGLVSSSPRNSGEIQRSPINRKPVPAIPQSSDSLPLSVPQSVPPPTSPSTQSPTAGQEAPIPPPHRQQFDPATQQEQPWPLPASPQQGQRAVAPAPQPATRTTPEVQPVQPVQQAPPPPASVPDPWVPPGFHLDEGHSFEVANSAASSPPTPPHAVPVRMNPPQPIPTMQAPVPRKPVASRLAPASGGGARMMDKELPPLNPDARVRSPHAPRSSSPLRNSNIYPDGPPPPLPPKPAPQPQDGYIEQPPPVPKRPNSPNLVPFQLTMIRRDPSTGNQWNIGKVSSVQSMEPDFQEGIEQTPIEQPSIRVHLETSGYAKFRGFPSRQSIEASAFRDPSTASLPRSLAGMAISSKNDQTASGFNREVVMAYTKSWTAGIKKAFKQHDRSSSENALDADMANSYPFELEPPNRQRMVPHARNSSQTSVGSFESFPNEAAANRESAGSAISLAAAAAAGPGGRESPNALITRPGPGLKPRGYIFTSPWDGRCEFRTGNGGRTLRCRHILNPAGGSGGGYNPLVMAQNLRDGQGIAGAATGRNRASSLSSAITGATMVSELRFNLPSGDLFRPKQHKPTGNRAGDLYGKFQTKVQNKVQDQLQKHYRQGSSTTEDDYDEEDEIEFDEEVVMGLGKEKAGGGNRGKRAKLGKLIIYDDGFKMLDLVVASNIGIWWVSWEKSL